eukprot:TRINITY_DN19954_c0_g1_i1.p1 TRINITY_DN19954_c0_g1~~TRINITY_DN19954_c0_g1_i1.p1  ORF type:complete len:260 (+),score=55.85 TRINITY_DN19954_c0_g1_i1:49-828(+)
MKLNRHTTAKSSTLLALAILGVVLLSLISVVTAAGEDTTLKLADPLSKDVDEKAKEQNQNIRENGHHDETAEIHNEGRTREIRTHQRHRERIRHDHISRLLHQEHRDAVKQNVNDHEEIEQRMKNRYKSFVDSRVPGRDDESHLEHGFDYEEYDDVREHMRDKHSRYNPYLGYYMFEAKYKLAGAEATFEDCFDRANQWSHRLEALTDVPCEVIPRNRETLLITVRDVTHGPYVESLVKKFEDCISIEFKTRFDPPHLV